MLVVEDHQQMRELLRNYLQTTYPDRRVMDAADGKTALDLCALHQPKVVLMDIGLPDTSGIELTAKITARAPKTAVIMLTSIDDEVYRRRAADAGAQAYVTKERIYQDLLPAIQTALTRYQNPLPAMHPATLQDISRLRELLTLTPDPMLLVDTTGHILAANDLCCRWLAHTPGSLEGMSVNTVFPTLDWPPADPSAEPAEPASPSTDTRKLEIVARRANNSELLVELATRRIGDARDGVLVASLHDVTVRSRIQDASDDRNESLEQDLHRGAGELAIRSRELEQRKAELEQANEELLAFSYSVSHDLRAPLRAISGFAQILSRRHRAELSAQAQHYVDNIIEASTHMGLLIDDLLGYSRLGHTAVERQPIAVDDVIAEIMTYLQPRIDDCRAALTIDGALPVVAGDRTLLKQIFTNLLENALTYHRPGSPPAIRVHGEAVGRHAMISVSDAGIGIAPEHHEKIFNVFHRLHSQEDFPGTGIGLAVVRKAVDLLGGRVWLESQTGSGSTFHVQLPLARADTTAGGSAPENHLRIPQ